MRPLDSSCFSGAGAYVATPSDLVRFGMAINSHTLLKPATVQLLQRSLRLPSGEETGYGLGWDLDTVSIANNATPSIGHEGRVLGGVATSFRIFPERNLVVAVSSNISYADPSDIALKIAQAFGEQAAPSSSRPVR